MQPFKKKGPTCNFHAGRASMEERNEKAKGFLLPLATGRVILLVEFLV
jgi:hypothetical protein